MDKILIIGNKPYHKLPMSDLIDEFEENCRCGIITVTPEFNNGSKLSHLALCNHAWERLWTSPLNREDFISYYGKNHQPFYLETFWDFFQANKHRYKEVFHSPPTLTSKWNNMLSSWGCPYRINKVPRTGMSAIFENLVKQKKVFVTNFSLYDSVRYAWGGNYEEGYTEDDSCHSRDDEINILFWLHHNGYVDATFCMLEDKEVPTLRCKNIQPTPDGLRILTKIYGNLLIEE